MKTLYIKYLGAFTAISTVVIACSKEATDQTPAPAAEPVTITVTVADENTGSALSQGNANLKTSIDENDNNAIIWGTTDEEMTLVLTQTKADASEYISYNTSTGITVDGTDATVAAFTFSVQAVRDATEFTYSGIYPASAVATNSTDNDSQLGVNLPAIQNATASSYDPSAYIMTVHPETFGSLQTEWTAYYRRATALNKITLTNVAEPVSAVEITIPDSKLAGRRYIDLTTGNSGDIYSNSASTIRINYATALTAGSMDIWFTSWEATAAVGSTLTVTAYGTDNSYSKTITAAGTGISFTEGKLNKLTINMDRTLETVTTTPNVDYSGTYLIAAPASATTANWHLMTSENASNRYTSLYTEVTTALGTVNASEFAGTSGISSCLWTLAYTDGGYSIKNEKTGLYLNMASDSGNLSASAEPVVLSVRENTDNADYYIISASGSAYELQKNSSNSTSSYFAGYQGTQRDVTLIKWDYTNPILMAAREQTKTVTAVETNVTFEYEALNVTDLSVSTTDASNIIAGTSTENGVLTVTLNPNGDATEKTATVTLSATGVSDVTYTITQQAAGTTRYYVKVTATPADWAGQYLIVFEDINYIYNGALTGSATTFGNTGNTYEISSTAISDGKIVANDDMNNHCVYIEKDENNIYSLKTASGYYLRKTSTGISGATTYNATNHSMTFTLEETTNYVKITNSDDTAMQYRKDSSYDYVRFYLWTSSYYKPSLYKLEETTSLTE